VAYPEIAQVSAVNNEHALRHMQLTLPAKDAIDAILNTRLAELITISLFAGGDDKYGQGRFQWPPGTALSTILDAVRASLPS
jgi:hypothetical protein